MPISTIGSNSLNQTSDLTINGQTVGKGGGNTSTNTVHGVSALAATNTIGNCTAIGYQALTLTTGKQNTAVGSGAGASMTSGEGLAAFGWNAANLNTGDNNTAIGHNSLGSNTTASNNTACGNAALNANTTGASNVAVGRQALVSNTTASYGTAIGFQAGYSQTTATSDYNTFVGYYAGRSTTGGQNTFLGKFAGNAITTGTTHTIIGAYNGNQGGLDIRTNDGYVVLSDGGGNPRGYFDNIGRLYVPASYTYTTGNAVNMSISSSGLIERSTSSLKYKKNVADATHGLTDLLKLRSVTYQGKSESDGEKVFGGLIAEEVHDAGLTEFVQYADDGSPDALAYGNMVSLCVKAIQELKTIVDAQAAEIAELKAKVA
jgi:hypothetical protein